MFAFISKKLSLPGGARVRSISWDHKNDWLACGAEDGVLRVIKFETGCDDSTLLSSKIGFNIALEGHSGHVNCCDWNPRRDILISSDETGQILIWKLESDSQWIKERVIKLKNGPVQFVKWSPDGERIAVACSTGLLSTYCPRGALLWNKSTAVKIRAISWDHFGNTIIIGTEANEVLQYAQTGEKVARAQVDSNGFRNQNSKDDHSELSLPNHTSVVAIDATRYKDIGGYVEPRLAIATSTGLLFITDDLNVESKWIERMNSKPSKVPVSSDTVVWSPVIVDTKLCVKSISWNATGTVIAVLGTKIESSQEMVQVEARIGLNFYSSTGVYLCSSTLPGSSASGCAWEGGGLRFVTATESLYFSTVKPEYKWTYLRSKLCYEAEQDCLFRSSVVFWDMEKNRSKVVRIAGLESIFSSNDFVALTYNVGSRRRMLAYKGGRNPRKSAIFGLQLRDSEGSLIENKALYFQPAHLCMSATCIVASNSSAVHLWFYKKSQSSNIVETAEASSIDWRNEIVFYVDDSGISKLCHLSGTESLEAQSRLQEIASYVASDPINCLNASEGSLLLAHRSGIIKIFSLCPLSLISSISVSCIPMRVCFNLSSTRVSVIDCDNVLSIFALGTDNKLSSGFPKLRDVWGMSWSLDDPEALAVMDKGMLKVIHGTELESIASTGGYICVLEDFQVTTVLLNGLCHGSSIETTEKHSEKLIRRHRTRLLRDFHCLINSRNYEDALKFVSNHPRPSLWSILIRAALENFQYTIAYRAFVETGDIYGIKLLESTRNLDDLACLGMIYEYLEEFDKAESVFLQAGRKDLAVANRRAIGDWIGVARIISQWTEKDGASKTKRSKRIFECAGKQLLMKKNWQGSIQYFTKAKRYDMVAQCHIAADNCDLLEELLETIPKNMPGLDDIGARLFRLGFCESACKAFLKAGNIKEAINCCTKSFAWDRALALGKEFRISSVWKDFKVFALAALEKGTVNDILNVYQSIKGLPESLWFLAVLARKKLSIIGLRNAKKTYVFLATHIDNIFEDEAEKHDAVDRSTSRQKNPAEHGKKDSEGSFTQHRNYWSNEDKLYLQDCWDCARGIHLYILAQKYLHKNEMISALVTCIQLPQYLHILNPWDVYSIIALVSCYIGAWGQAINSMKTAIVMPKDETDHESIGQMRDLVAYLSAEGKTVDPPNIHNLIRDMSNGIGSEYSCCMASGKPFNEADVYYVQCKQCSSKVIESEITGTQACPVCDYQQPLCTLSKSNF